MLSRTTAVVKKHRVQAAATKQNPFQRRLDLTSYALTVASGNSGRTFSLRDLSETAGTKFLEWSSASGREVQAE
jgi:putative membrane protein